MSCGDTGGHFDDIGHLGGIVDRLLCEIGIETSSIGRSEEQSPLGVVTGTYFVVKASDSVWNRPKTLWIHQQHREDKTYNLTPDA